MSIKSEMRFKPEDITEEYVKNNSTELKRYCLTVAPFSTLLICLFLGFGAWGMYSFLPFKVIKILQLPVISAAILSVFIPVVWFFWGRKHQRLWVRAYAAFPLSLMVLYFFGGMLFLFPIYFAVNTLSIKILWVLVVILVLIYSTWVTAKEVRRTMHKLNYPEKAFIEVGEVIVFDRSRTVIWSKTYREVINPKRFQMWIVMGLGSVGGPAIAILSPTDQHAPWIFFAFPLVTEYATAWVWSRILIMIGAYIVYPFYLEFKTGKPVIETGTAGGLN